MADSIEPSVFIRTRGDLVEIDVSEKGDPARTSFLVGMMLKANPALLMRCKITLKADCLQAEQ